MISIQRRNPRSRELFENEKIERIQGIGVDVIKQLSSNRFSVVIHDPSAQRLARQLFIEDYAIIVKLLPQDKDAAVKHKECEKRIRENAFARAIESDSLHVRVSGTIDVSSMTVEDSCTGS